MKMNRFSLAIALCTLTSSAWATTVFRNVNDNGAFLPFSSSTPAGTRFGDGGWLSNFGPDTYTLTEITLGLASLGGTNNGSTDLVFTFNDGDPSGQVFGSGAALYSTTITNVFIPAEESGEIALFSITIPLPNVVTSGGFNNIGFSVGVSNFNFDGTFGFQCSSGFGQAVGFYTNNASQFDGSQWSLFSFGPGLGGVANFVAEIKQVPAPGAMGLLGVACLGMTRRRRPA